MSEILDQIRARAAELAPTFGDGWLTKSASDLVRIAVVLAGFDRRELIPRLARVRSRGTLLNARTVERVMGEISDEHKRRDEFALVVWYLAVVT